MRSSRAGRANRPSSIIAILDAVVAIGSAIVADVMPIIDSGLHMIATIHSAIDS